MGRKIATAGKTIRTRSFDAAGNTATPDDYDSAAIQLLNEHFGLASASPVGRTRSLDAGETVKHCAGFALRFMAADVAGDKEAVAQIEGEFGLDTGNRIAGTSERGRSQRPCYMLKADNRKGRLGAKRSGRTPWQVKVTARSIVSNHS